MAALFVADRFRRAGSHLDPTSNLAISPVCRLGSRSSLLAVWTMGADGRPDLHWDIGVPPSPG